MSAEEIIRLVSLSVSLLISLSGLLMALIKAVKNKKWDSLKVALLDFVQQAEDFVEYTGEQKKQAVMTWAEDFCKKQGMTFDKDRVSEIIEELISFTKKVNPREKDKK